MLQLLVVVMMMVLCDLPTLDYCSAVDGKLNALFADWTMTPLQRIEEFAQHENNQASYMAAS